MKGGDSGPAVKPGKPSESLLVQRILGQGGMERMPMGFAPLSDEKVRAVVEWIAAGAKAPSGASTKPWSYVAPVRPPVPLTRNRAWVRNPVDAFVLDRLEREGLSPSPQAEKTTLIRRLTLDLTGLPPTLTEVDAFLADPSDRAYETVVDRLLKSPRYGERMALPWLDAARYADSNGFQQDGDTFQYVWRDWVVQAYNDDMPFDRFAMEQIAGDLFPKPTVGQRVATAFNRNHMLNGEGGAIPEEQRNVVLFDRVDVTSTTFLGLTMACARCHDHKYDPVSQKDFYRLMAYFNNVPETGVPAGSGQYRIADPWIYAGDAAQLKTLQDAEAAATKAADALKAVQSDPSLDRAFDAWLDRTARDERKAKTRPLVPGAWIDLGRFKADSFDQAYDRAFSPETDASLQGTERSDVIDGTVHPLEGENTAFYFRRRFDSPDARKVLLSFGSDDAVKAWWNGRPVVAVKTTRGAAPDQERAIVDVRRGRNDLLLKILNGGGIGGFVFQAHRTSAPDSIAGSLAEGRDVQRRKQARETFLTLEPPPRLRAAKALAESAAARLEAVRSATPRVMVMSDAMPRETHVYSRGNYESPLEAVTCGTPDALPRSSADLPANRLGLARWIVSAENPLTARVQVNRIWQTFFGAGLVKTSENFGVQGEPPSHPELLDWLAVEFRESGWSVKKLVRTIVTSATYRQSSRQTPELLAKDPSNRLLARGARFRLPSFFIRDTALAASGLLDLRTGGKPVYPYQPKDIWDGLAITKERDFTYPQSHGRDLYRRSLYTFWRRTAAPGNMFDASSRQACTVRNTVTSTPMHALTTLNDVTWVEAGRVLAERVMKASKSPRQRLADAFRRVCSRIPRSDELDVLERGLTRSQERFRAHPDEAVAYLSQGDSPRDPKLDPIEAAAYASVCHAVFNLDEALTRE